MRICSTHKSGSGVRVHVPVAVCRRCGISAGEYVCLSDLPNGRVVMTPLKTKLEDLAHKKARALADEDGITLD